MSYARTRDSRIARLLAVALLIALGAASINCVNLASPNGWNDRWGPLVPHRNFPADCGLCHIPDDWQTLRENFEFDHLERTGYALEGAHADAMCLRCHNDRGPVQAYVQRGCAGCHVDPHQGTLGLDCSECHDQETWRPVELLRDHAGTRFPLTGMHALTPCESCHVNAPVGDYRGAQSECQFCHQRDAAAAFPNHLLNGFTDNCEKCHSTSNWDAIGVEHDFFPLIGGHGGLDCTQCHVNGQLGPLDPNCFACHQSDYIAAPNHVANNFSTDCTECHNIFDWQDVSN